MNTELLLKTKTSVPPTRAGLVHRPRLTARLNDGVYGLLTLVSAPAGAGKTQLLAEWAAQCDRPVAWLSLDEADRDPSRFLSYLFTAIKGITPDLQNDILPVLQSPQPPPIESVLTLLINEISALPHRYVLILDDYHLIDSEPIEFILTFILKHMPPQMHLVISTREEPKLPLARLRARALLNEVRSSDLRFTLSEATEFLNQVMRLNLSTEEAALLENRTEGWIAGLQIAALSMQVQQDKSDFVRSFSGSHRYLLEYLTEEILQQQSDQVQEFLLSTAILDQFCAPLCDAVLPELKRSSRSILDYLEGANLFIVPLDQERHWYRYHHLFADSLRQRLDEQMTTSGIQPSSRRDELHIRASEWYEAHGYELEAFRHAAAAHDIERAERLVEGRGVPLHFRGAVTTILDWLATLPTRVLDARPSLWWLYASLMLINGQTTGVDEKLNAAEAVVAHLNSADEKRAFRGQLAAARSVLALSRYQIDAMQRESGIALADLPAESTLMRAYAHWTRGFALFLQGHSDQAYSAYTDALKLSQKSGGVFTGILATIGLANIQEAENQLHRAAETYKQVIHASGNQPLQIIHEAHLGLARILYEWNDLDGAQRHGEQALLLAKQYDQVIDRFIICEIFLARLKLTQGYTASASAILNRLLQILHQPNFAHRLPEVCALQVSILLRQGNIEAAERLARKHNLLIPLTRVLLARGRADEAIRLLTALLEQAQSHARHDDRLRVLVLLAVASHMNRDSAEAIDFLNEALAAAESGGFIRLFVDEGEPMAQLLSSVTDNGLHPEYMQSLLSAMEAERAAMKSAWSAQAEPPQPLLTPLTPRELEVLKLISSGLSNQQISQRLFVALSTVKGHNQRIFEKLHVQRRTEAIVRARQLGLL